MCRCGFHNGGTRTFAVRMSAAGNHTGFRLSVRPEKSRRDRDICVEPSSLLRMSRGQWRRRSGKKGNTLHHGPRPMVCANAPCTHLDFGTSHRAAKIVVHSSRIHSAECVGGTPTDAAAASPARSYRQSCRSCADEGLYCTEDTMVCLLAGCIPCAYKIVVQPSLLNNPGAAFRPNKRPEECLRQGAR